MRLFCPSLHFACSDVIGCNIQWNRWCVEHRGNSYVRTAHKPKSPEASDLTISIDEQSKPTDGCYVINCSHFPDKDHKDQNWEEEFVLMLIANHFPTADFFGHLILEILK